MVVDRRGAHFRCPEWSTLAVGRPCSGGVVGLLQTLGADQGPGRGGQQVLHAVTRAQILALSSAIDADPQDSLP